MHAGHPPISTSMFDHVFRGVGLTMQQVREDRILFGISDGTAMRYTTAAHLERTTEIPP
ncbi:hypothetical protein [Streptomyces sp. CdTB01]|uniref:hypothetical protein n=1 Tax=Streptomyces sp. CdTB01 TaxID=1725411 RepID=UPI000AC63A4F|nr:hypothetical protein [Streptomyces sp. CdTB01]